MKITPAIEQWFLTEIDAWKLKLQARGRKNGDRAALWWSMVTHYAKKYRQQGHSPAAARARALAYAKGPDFQRVFETRRRDLYRLRGETPKP